MLTLHMITRQTPAHVFDTICIEPRDSSTFLRPLWLTLLYLTLPAHLPTIWTPAPWLWHVRERGAAGAAAMPPAVCGGRLAARCDGERLVSWHTKGLCSGET